MNDQSRLGGLCLLPGAQLATGQRQPGTRNPGLHGVGLLSVGLLSVGLLSVGLHRVGLHRVGLHRGGWRRTDGGIHGSRNTSLWRRRGGRRNVEAEKGESGIRVR